jgi:hypothetical protein
MMVSRLQGPGLFDFFVNLIRVQYDFPIGSVDFQVTSYCKANAFRYISLFWW